MSLKNKARDQIQISLEKIANIKFGPFLLRWFPKIILVVFHNYLNSSWMETSVHFYELNQHSVFPCITIKFILFPNFRVFYKLPLSWLVMPKKKKVFSDRVFFFFFAKKTTAFFELHH